MLARSPSVSIAVALVGVAALGLASGGTPAAGTPGKAPPAPPPASAPSACQRGMQLVDGQYCELVQERCEQSWYDPANKKVVCERFASPRNCTGKRVHKRFCVDRYEWPNQSGQRPEVMNNFYQAQVKCAALGKRLCTESEWTLACEGEELRPFPYGFVRDAQRCNGDRPWDKPDMSLVARRDAGELARLWQGVPSGSQPECLSTYGVYDLPGNVDEVAASENLSNGGRGKYDSVTTGGPWYKGVRNQCRPKIYSHDEGFYHYYLGFRCCAEPDGHPSDPLTKKQIRRGLSFAAVERLARFTVKEMQEKLELRARAACTCPPQDKLCRTMCGTLLGPGATDARPRPAQTQ